MGPSVGVTEAGRTAHSRILIKGAIRGVGFRPLVFSLAENHQLNGLVRNALSVQIVPRARHAWETFSCIAATASATSTASGRQSAERIGQCALHSIVDEQD